jgi:hypothetical protein
VIANPASGTAAVAGDGIVKGFFYILNVFIFIFIF